MSESSKISWLRWHDGLTGQDRDGLTFNPWRGCEPFGPGCAHCYASPIVTKLDGGFGARWKRTMASAEVLNSPFRANAAAEKRRLLGEERGLVSEPPKVFSLSLGDFLDENAPEGGLAKLLNTVRLCKELEWLLLTHRPTQFAERFGQLIDEQKADKELVEWVTDWLDGRPPSHVRIGATASTQFEATTNLRALSRIPAASRFVSFEPMLQEIRPREAMFGCHGFGPLRSDDRCENAFDLFILGGQSGFNSGPKRVSECRVEWIRSIISAFSDSTIAVFVKQMGSRPSVEKEEDWPTQCRKVNVAQRVWPQLSNAKGEDPQEWPEDLRLRQWPKPIGMPTKQQATLF